MVFSPFDLKSVGYTLLREKIPGYDGDAFCSLSHQIARPYPDDYRAEAWPRQQFLAIEIEL